MQMHGFTIGEIKFPKILTGTAFLLQGISEYWKIYSLTVKSASVLFFDITVNSRQL